MSYSSRLKVYIEQPGFSVGCVDLEYSEEEMKSFPMASGRLQVGKILVKLREKYGDDLRVDLIDPRSLTAMLDILKYRIKSTEPTWILDGKLIFRGVPEWEELQAIIDAFPG
ncbi:MAG TPA: hypothetical protein PLP89_03170 [Synergistales bacterium]|jgi:hypothetical protein|nr:hypothetical protein [Synergistales bacterium]HRV71325.1 hypothetical protein [Thermovirgaceae bacterium]